MVDFVKTLAIDVGNSDTVVGGISESGRICFTSRLPTLRRSSSELESWLEFICRKYSVVPQGIGHVCVASVVPSVNEIWTQASKEFFHQEPWFLNSQSAQALIKMEVDHPEEVGADRIANAVAARLQTKKAAIVMDFGTATTFDVVSAKGAYVGGLIAPGLNLAVESLSRATALLPRISLRETNSVIGKNTIEAMTAGAYWGYVAMIDGLISRFQLEMNGKNEGDFLLFATGGLARLICKSLKDRRVEIDPDLTLKGLYEVSQCARTALA